MRVFLPTQKLFFSLYCPLIDVVTDATNSIIDIDTRHLGNPPAMQHNDFHIIMLMESKDCPAASLQYSDKIGLSLRFPYAQMDSPLIARGFALAKELPGDVLNSVILR